MKRDRGRPKKKTHRFREQVFDALVLHILHSWSPKKIDARVLCHILYQIDMQAYLQSGKSITGLLWTKGDDFPVPCRTGKEASKMASLWRGKSYLKGTQA